MYLEQKNSGNSESERSMTFGNIEVANEKTRAVSFAVAVFTRLDTNKLFSKTLCIIHSATRVAVFVRKKNTLVAVRTNP